MARKIALIVDDEPDIRELLEITLGRMAITTFTAADITSAKLLLAERAYDFCLTDMKLPDGNGIELIVHIQNRYPHLPCAVITAHGSQETAVEALKAGAFDFVSKPVNLEQLRSLVDDALNLKPLDSTKTIPDSAKLLGNTAVMKEMRKQILKLARSQAPIYISGESGSGKELVARVIHELGPHSEAPFIPVNCGAIPSELMESEFFGHKKGSFTGAINDKTGLFQAANGGTLFLDEVADLPLPMQVKLLRGIQERAIRPIGSQQEIPVNVRILSATHKDLVKEVALGSFRQDLYYRINVIELRVPSLRERTADIPDLADDLLKRVALEYDRRVPTIDPEALQKLSNYHFPGNVRELLNILERAFTLCENDVIRAADLNLLPCVEGSSTEADSHAAEESGHGEEPLQSTQTESTQDVDSLASYLEDIEKNVIIEALESTRWNKTAAARKLGITFRALRYRLKKLQLQ